MKQIIVILAFMIFGLPLKAEVRIAVVGANNDMDLIEQWASAESALVNETRASHSFKIDNLNARVLAPTPETSPAQVASVLYQANAAMIVIDATKGPLPINREHIILARQARVPVVAIMLANVDELHSLAPHEARELLKLVEEEVRFLMASYELDGRSALLFHDAKVGANTPKSSSGGLSKAGSVVSSLTVGGSRDQPTDPQRQGRGQVYLLTNAETNGRAASISASSAMVMWSEGASTAVEVTSATALAPGDVGEVTIHAPRMFLGEAGSRFVLIQNESVVGIGVLTEVSRFTSSD